MKKIFLMISACMVLGMMACTDSSTPQPQDNNDDINDPGEPQISKVEMISRAWTIDSAYHEGNWDASSSGKDITFNSNGTYNFDNSFNGVWYFTLDSSKVIIDEGTQFQQDWTIETLSEERFVAKFNSPFTGKPSEWRMNAK